MSDLFENDDDSFFSKYPGWPKTDDKNGMISMIEYEAINFRRDL